MVGPPWIAVLGSGPRVDADNRSHTNPLTGKPDAGDPPVRFGGRGSGKPLSLPLSPFYLQLDFVGEMNACRRGGDGAPRHPWWRGCGRNTSSQKSPVRAAPSALMPRL